MNAAMDDTLEHWELVLCTFKPLAKSYFTLVKSSVVHDLEYVFQIPPKICMYVWLLKGRRNHIWRNAIFHAGMDLLHTRKFQL